MTRRMLFMRNGLRGARMISMVAGTVLLTSAGVLKADLLTFEDLPIPGTSDPTSPAADPLPSSYHGFEFESNWNAPATTQWDFTWVSWYLQEELQNPYPGDPNFSGKWNAYVSGEHALGNVAHYGPLDYTAEWSIRRTDGGLWTFDGAWFTANTGRNTIFVRGYLAGTQVLDLIRPMASVAPTFQAPLQPIVLDRLVVLGGPEPGGLARDFYMDDFQYTLVPTPGACVLLLLSGVVMRARRRA